MPLTSPPDQVVMLGLQNCDRITLVYRSSLLDRNGNDETVGLRADGDFHLHGFNQKEGIPLGHALTRRSLDLPDESAHFRLGFQFRHFGSSIFLSFQSRPREVRLNQPNAPWRTSSWICSSLNPNKRW